ncbi:hypothetical protein J1614_009353 [Plenodomus biglobosus]|nr:hypothetical protein J1614_009353 [Plenodomus biglobosus]
MLAARACPLRLASSTIIIKASNAQTLKSSRMYSDAKSEVQSNQNEALNATTKPAEEVQPKKKTQAELDKELLVKLQGLDGDGGSAGVEYEDGKPVSMKRSVRNNMFRYI